MALTVSILLSVSMITSLTVEAFWIPTPMKQNQNEICYTVTREPSYLRTVVTGKPWHAYYAWNMNAPDVCLKTIFRVSDDMNKVVKFLRNKNFAMKVQPDWSKPELLLYRGQNKEMVLFKDRSGIPGQFDGIPNIRRNELPRDKPLRYPFKMTMKVIEKGKYLILSDCTSGVTLLLLHPETRPKRVEIDAYASSLNFGEPSPACSNEPDPIIKNKTIVDFIETTIADTTTKKVSKYDW